MPASHSPGDDMKKSLHSQGHCPQVDAPAEGEEASGGREVGGRGVDAVCCRRMVGKRLRKHATESS